MATLTCATTVFSCGLACVESILADNGVVKTQSEMIAAYGHLFPQWVAQPGITSPAACETVFREVGFPVTVTRPATSIETISRLSEADTVGAILFVTKFYDDAVTRQTLSDLNHILRLLKADHNGISVMNPYRCPSPGKIEDYSWQEVVSFQGGVLVFKR
jgi:hypothetical protein